MKEPVAQRTGDPAESEPLVLPLDEVDASMVGRVGGKAANLGELIQAGFPVPQGFCITTTAYRAVVAHAGVDAELAALERLPTGDAPELAALAPSLRTSISTAPVSDEIRNAVLGAYKELGDRPMVAVRSSATAEDLPFASFAGQQDTYLGVVGADQLIEAVRRCWASLWTDRAVSYRTNQHIDHRTVRLAVVVQLMVPSEVAGVLFTANPVTGRRREAVIDASPGLGDAVVSGAVTPDHLIVDTATGRLLQTRPGDRTVAIRTVRDGGTERIAVEGGDGRLCLTGEQAGALAAIGDRVERHYSSPQDIEWAFDAAGKLWLTQSRPITTLFPLPDSPAGRDLRVYFCFSVAQGLYRPLTPMGLSAFRVLSSGAARLLGTRLPDPIAGSPFYAEAGERVFFELTGAVRSRVGRALLPRVFDLMETRSAVIMRQLFERPELSVTHRSLLPAIRRAARIGFRYRIPLYAAQGLVNPSAAHRRVQKIGDDLRTRLAVRDDASAAQRLQHAVDVLNREALPMAPRVVPAALAGLAMFGLATRLLRGLTEPGQLQSVLRGVPHNVTTEMDLQLWNLLQRIRSDQESADLLRSTPPAALAERFHTGGLPTVLQTCLTLFLADYPHRAIAEIDVGVPRWSEDPTYILGVMANYLQLEDPSMAPDVVFARSTREARAMIDRLSAVAAQRGRWRSPVVRFTLGRARELAGIREMPKYFIVLALAAVRSDLAAVGVVLATDGRIDKADDVFFLTIGEARDGLAGRSLHPVVEARRAVYEQEMRRRRVPRVLLSDGTEPENTEEAAGPTPASMVGVPASPGTAAGTARVVLDPVGARLAPGEILVAPSTDPGWTPLFLTAGGLVMEMGGANSHGAVVAREYGIPAVVGVPRATERVSSGDLLTVDGTAGTVNIDQVRAPSSAPDGSLSG